jgi:hypothetical protein
MWGTRIKWNPSAVIPGGGGGVCRGSIAAGQGQRIGPEGSATTPAAPAEEARQCEAELRRRRANWWSVFAIAHRQTARPFTANLSQRVGQPKGRRCSDAAWAVRAALPPRCQPGPGISRPRDRHDVGQYHWPRNPDIGKGVRHWRNSCPKSVSLSTIPSEYP